MDLMSPDKPTLRQQARNRRDQIPDRAARSQLIAERVLATPLVAAAQCIHCYLPIRSEVDTYPLLTAALAGGKRVVVPVVLPDSSELQHAWLASLDSDALVTGVFGTPTPRALRLASGGWDVVIVPLLAFDRRCHRLGYGKGHYDRFLARYPGTTVGVAFAAQEVPFLPVGLHDVALTMVATEAELIIASPG